LQPATHWDSTWSPFLTWRILPSHF
jgi:hypothetical protein